MLNDISNTMPANAAVGLMGDSRLVAQPVHESTAGMVTLIGSGMTYGRTIHALRRFTQASLNKEPAGRGRRDG
jgi:hypothetical protein